MKNALSNYDFGRSNLFVIRRAYDAITAIEAYSGAKFTTTEIAEFFESVSYSLLRELNAEQREAIAMLYDAILVDDEHKKADYALRLSAVNWLVWNDSNGIYRDDDLMAEDWHPMTMQQALEAVNNAMAED